jgi:prepilin-type N-terminal cleavage/methylation domain-containing protein
MTTRRRRGFTLLELLVAVVLTLGIAAVMLAVTTSTLTLWRRSQDRFSTAAQAKLALDFLERDLQAGVFREDTATTWLAVTVANNTAGLTNHGWQTTLRMKPATSESLALLPTANGEVAPTIAQARFGVSGAWLRFIATNVETSGSLPVALSYQIVRRPVSGSNVSSGNPAEVRYTLFRSAVASDTSFAIGNDVLAAGYNSASEAPSNARAASTLTNPSTGSDTLVTNAVDFGVWLYVRAPDGSLRRIFPVEADDLTHTARDAGGAADGNRYPDVADVMVRVLTEDGARQIAAIEQGTIARPPTSATDAQWWWSVVEANSVVFVRRIEWKGGAL